MINFKKVLIFFVLLSSLAYGLLLTDLACSVDLDMKSHLRVPLASKSYEARLENALGQITHDPAGDQGNVTVKDLPEWRDVETIGPGLRILSYLSGKLDAEAKESRISISISREAERPGWVGEALDKYMEFEDINRELLESLTTQNEKFTKKTLSNLIEKIDVFLKKYEECYSSLMYDPDERMFLEKLKGKLGELKRDIELKTGDIPSDSVLSAKILTDIRIGLRFEKYDMQEIEGIASLHSIINFIHQAGAARIMRLGVAISQRINPYGTESGFDSATVTVGELSYKFYLLDASSGQDQSKLPLALRLFTEAVCRALVQNPDPSILAREVKLLIKDNFVFVILKLGEHHSTIALNIVDPNQGGLLRVHWVERGVGGSKFIDLPGTRHMFIKAVLEKLGMVVKMAPGSGIVDAVENKDIGARSVEEFTGDFKTLAALFMTTVNLDYIFAGLGPGSKEKVAEAWSDYAVSMGAGYFHGVTTFSDFNGLEEGSAILVVDANGRHWRGEGSYSDLRLKYLEENSAECIKKINNELERLNDELGYKGLFQIPSGLALNQKTVDQYLNIPVKTLLEREELIMTDKGPCRNPDFTRIGTAQTIVEEIIRDHLSPDVGSFNVESGVSAVKNAAIIRQFAARLDLQPVAFIGQYLVEKAVLDLLGGGRMTFYCLRENSPDSVIEAAFCADGEFFYDLRRERNIIRDNNVVLKILKDNGYIVDEASLNIAEGARAIYEKLLTKYQTIQSPTYTFPPLRDLKLEEAILGQYAPGQLLDVPVVEIVALSSGIATGRVSIGDGKHGGVLFSRSLPSEVTEKLIASYRGIVVQEQNLLSHFTVNARAFGLPVGRIDEIEYPEQHGQGKVIVIHRDITEKMGIEESNIRGVNVRKSVFAGIETFSVPEGSMVTVDTKEGNLFIHREEGLQVYDLLLSIQNDIEHRAEKISELKALISSTTDSYIIKLTLFMLLYADIFKDLRNDDQKKALEETLFKACMVSIRENENIKQEDIQDCLMHIFILRHQSIMDELDTLGNYLSKGLPYLNQGYIVLNNALALLDTYEEMLDVMEKSIGVDSVKLMDFSKLRKLAIEIRKSFVEHINDATNRYMAYVSSELDLQQALPGEKAAGEPLTADASEKVVWLDGDMRGMTDDILVKLLGGKAAGLNEAFQIVSEAGAVLPLSFVVSTDAYKTFLEEANVIYKNREMLLKNAIEEIYSDQKITIADKSGAIRNMFLGAKINPALEKNIIEAYGRFSGKPCAVRSSANVEDDLAGQFETFLFVMNTETLIERVKNIWASVWDQKILEYYKSIGNPRGVFDIKMAALIQEMADSEKSGVSCSIDPVGKLWDVVTINAGYGCCSGIVGSGRFLQDADLYRVETPTDKITYEAGKRAAKMVMAFDVGGLQVMDTSHAEKNIKVLSDRQILDIVSVIKKLETHFSSPLIIEFSYSDEGKLTILQVTRILGTEIER